MNFKPGDKVITLNDCMDDHFKKGDVVTLKQKTDNGHGQIIGWLCEELKSPMEYVYISINHDNFRLAQEWYNEQRIKKELGIK